MTHAAETARRFVYDAAQHNSHLYLTPNEVKALWRSIMDDGVAKIKAEDTAEDLMGDLCNTAHALRESEERGEYLKERAIFWRRQYLKVTDALDRIYKEAIDRADGTTP